MQIQDRFVRVEWIDDSQEIHQIEFAFDMRLSEAHAIERAKKEANNYIENGVIVKVSAYVAEPYLLTWELRQELTCEKILTDLLGTVAKDRGEYKLLFDWAEDLGLANLTYCYVVTPSGDVLFGTVTMDATDLSRPAEWWAWQFHQYVEIDQRRSGQLSLLEAE